MQWDDHIYEIASSVNNCGTFLLESEILHRIHTVNM